jgi:hypothetical protein
VQFVPLTGYSFTTKDAAAATDATDSDADLVTGKTQVVKLASGENNPTLDAGLTPDCRPVTFDFSGSSATDGTDGNSRTYTDALTGVSVTARAFSQSKGQHAHEHLADRLAWRLQWWTGRHRFERGYRQWQHPYRGQCRPQQLRRAAVLAERETRPGLSGLRGQRQRHAGMDRQFGQYPHHHDGQQRAFEHELQRGEHHHSELSTLGRPECRRGDRKRGDHRCRHHRHLAGRLLQSREGSGVCARLLLAGGQGQHR